MIFLTIEDARQAGLGKWLPCSCCAVPFELVKRVQRNGVDAWLLRCTQCRQSGGSIAYDKLPPAAQNMTAKEVRPNPSQPCERCGEWRNGVEWHHWAPSEFFADCSDWPTSYLCRACHALWHKKMREQKKVTDEEHKEYFRELYNGT